MTLPTSAKSCAWAYHAQIIVISKNEQFSCNASAKFILSPGPTSLCHQVRVLQGQMAIEGMQTCFSFEPRSWDKNFNKTRLRQKSKIKIKKDYGLQYIFVSIITNAAMEHCRTFSQSWMVSNSKTQIWQWFSFLHQWSFEQWIVPSRFNTQPVTRKRMHCNCFIPFQFKLCSIHQLKCSPTSSYLFPQNMNIWCLDSK